MRCKHCKRLKVSPSLLTALDRLRKNIRRPIRVTSAYRCPIHNRRIGGSKNSQHLKGRAADIHARNMTVNALWAAAEQVGALSRGGIGVYPRKRFVHVDVRKHPARWIG